MACLAGMGHALNFHMVADDPLNWSIRLGADRVFHNCFRYSSGVDDGQVFGESTLMIEPDDYIADIQKRRRST